jgi:hypothetical protein
MGKERDKQREKAGKQRKARGPRWALWETLLACHVVIAIRNKYAQGISGPELMREYNRLYAELADDWLKRDHYGLPDMRVTVEESKQHRISDVTCSTRKTPILRRFEDMVCKVRNDLLPLLDKKVLVDGKIPSGRQKEECIEELRVLYKQLLDKDGFKPTSGDEDVEGEGGINTSNLEDFHPHEFYVACEYGPTVLGGKGEVYFLKDALDMQEALANGVGSRNNFRSQKRTAEGNAAGAAKKKALSESLYEHSDNSVSPQGSSVSSRSQQSETMTSLAAKKLDHEIMKAHDDQFQRYRQCLENKVVREAPSLQPYLCVVLELA